MDGEQGLLVQGIDGVLLEYLLQEHLAQRRGELVDQTANAQVLVVDNILLGVEDLAHFNGDLGLLVALGQIPQMGGNGADTHHHRALTAGAECLLNRGGDLVQFLDAGALGHLADQDHIPLTDAEDKVILPVREQGLDHIGGNGLALLQGAHHKHAPGHIGGNPQFLGAHVNIAQHDVVGNDVLDKGATVVLLLIVGLGGVQGHGRHGADGLADFIVTKGKSRVVKLVAPAVQRLESLAIGGGHAASGIVDHRHILRPTLADHGQFAAGNDDALPVDHADRSVRVLFQLQHHVLKNSPRHGRPPHLSSHVEILCVICQ